MNDQSTPIEPGDDTPDIILLGIDRKSYYLYKGDKFINQLLLVDGEYPTPILCMHFETIINARAILGEGFSLANFWAIHPEICERLRNDGCLIEADA